MTLSLVPVATNVVRTPSYDLAKTQLTYVPDGARSDALGRPPTTRRLRGIHHHDGQAECPVRAPSPPFVRTPR